MPTLAFGPSLGAMTRTGAMAETKVLYRVYGVGFFFGDEQDFDIAEYPVIKETRCGFWVRDKYRKRKGLPNRRFVLREGTRVFARMSKKEAIVSFWRRKRKQVKHLEGEFKLAKDELDRTEVILSVGPNWPPAAEPGSGASILGAEAELELKELIES